jgi:hypothetical protein
MSKSIRRGCLNIIEIYLLAVGYLKHAIKIRNHKMGMACTKAHRIHHEAIQKMGLVRLMQQLFFSMGQSTASS